MKRLISLILSMLCFFALFGCAERNNASSSSTPPVSQEIDASSISLSKTSITLTVGEKTNIIATVRPNNTTNKKVTWSSTNSNVAECINGEIYALAEGSCLIKATTTNGITAVCNVQVEKAPVYAESVKFPQSTYCLNIGEEVSPILEISPELLNSYKGTISFSNNNIASATYSNDSNAQLNIVGLCEGETTITITLDGGKQASAKVIVLDCSKYVKINLPSTPHTVSYFNNASNNIYSTARIDSTQIAFSYPVENTILVTIVIKGTKTYDKYGSSSSSNQVKYGIVLYKENKVFCERTSNYTGEICVGETFTHSYKFAVSLDSNKTMREFTINFENHGI